MVPEYQHISYWDSSKLVVAFDTPVPVLAHKSAVINSLNLDSLNNFLNGNGLGLRSISEKDSLRPVQSVPSQLSSKPEEHKGLDLNSHIGKYLFRSTTGEDRTGVICFFLFDDATGEQSSYDVPGIVNLINANLEKLRNELHIPIV